MEQQSVPRCPVVEGIAFDPLDRAQVLDPHPWMRAARKGAPVFYMPEYDCWCVTRHADVLDVIRDTDTFSSRRVIDPRIIPGIERELPGGHPMKQGLVNTDPPDHDRMRKLAQKAFTPKMVAAYEPTTRRLAEGIIDEVFDAGRMNLVEGFSRRFTGQVITGVIGAPPEKAPDFMAWSDNLILSLTDAPPLGPGQEEALVDEVVAFSAWLNAFIEDRRVDPRDDYASLLVGATIDDGDGSDLTTVEVARILTNVISAGLDTTSSLIAHCAYRLLETPERWARLLRDPSLIPAAIEETLRFDGPLRGIRRDVVADTEIAGVGIPAGSVLYLCWASAQRDEEVFDDPDTFSLERDDVDRHFALGRWKHFCLGASLARMEARVAFEVMMDRLPALRLVDGAEPEVILSRLGAFVTDLEVQWDVPGQ